MSFSRHIRNLVRALSGRRLVLAMALALGACVAPGGQGSAISPVTIAPGAALALGAGHTDGDLPPIIFVHGNGDNASIWQTVIWRFESNGWPRNRLFALDAPYPLARADDSKEQAGRSGSADQTRFLAAEVERICKQTGAKKVVLIGNSRGGYAIRSYLRDGAGKDRVATAVLGGVPNHGVWKGSFNPGSEFNGSGAFLTQLNAPQGPDGLEVTPGVPVLTLRSDNNDKFAQPLGAWLGQPKLETGIGFDGPALKGATNLVLPGKDHREVSFHAEAFAETFRFLTGQTATRLAYLPEQQIVLNGKVAGLHDQGGTAGEPSNLPLVGAKLTVYQVEQGSGTRIGGPVHQKTITADGFWGPFQAKPQAYYEFVIEAASFAQTHLYRSPFPRSSQVVNMRPARVLDADKDAVSVVTMNRPRGYFGVGRDQMSLDGQTPPPGVPPGVAGISTSKLKIAAPGLRTVDAHFNAERISMLSWPVAAGQLVFAEFHD
jgi:triacylglycerol lipase